MESGNLGIGELAESAGLSRRAVRFYVQQRLLPSPSGRGRGRHYDASHLERLRRISELQAAGHSLDAIRRILDGQMVEPPTAPPRPAQRAKLSAGLWTRLKLLDGVELHFDASKYQPEIEKLLALREAARDAFADDTSIVNHKDATEMDSGQDGSGD
jgi:DNA-binding transcriptional MerR regulator